MKTISVIFPTHHPTDLILCYILFMIINKYLYIFIVINYIDIFIFVLILADQGFFLSSLDPILTFGCGLIFSVNIY